jgi:hypothetical protein
LVVREEIHWHVPMLELLDGVGDNFEYMV